MTETIQGLRRGLQVLRVLQNKGTSSLQDLHVTTRISKPSLLRILNTLAEAGAVTRRLADGRFRASAGLLRMDRRGDRHDRIAEAAGPVLDQLCRKISWPSDVLVPAGTHLEIRETSRTHSPFRVHIPTVGQPVGWLMTGVGRAYLAFCSDKERERTIQRLRKTRMLDDRLAHDPRRLAKILADTRARGYGIRDDQFSGGAYGAAPLRDGLAALAVPLLGADRIYGVMNILWIRTAFTVEQFAQRHLGDLREAAGQIVSAVEAHDVVAGRARRA